MPDETTPGGLGPDLARQINDEQTTHGGRDSSERLTPSQARVLGNLRRGFPAHYGIYGRSAFGGLTRTMHSLRRLGLVDADGCLTEAPEPEGSE
jgi:hypothetical protein